MADNVKHCRWLLNTMRNNAAILTTAINQYKGTVVVVAHDEAFLDEINTSRVIAL